MGVLSVFLYLQYSLVENGIEDFLVFVDRHANLLFRQGPVQKPEMAVLYVSVQIIGNHKLITYDSVHFFPAPRCFEIERKLKECCDIPIFHDDQHGTAVVTMAAMLNALKVVGKKIDEIKVVTSEAGAAGIAIIKLLISMGLKNVIMCDRKGAIYKGREGLNKEKEEMAEISNRNMEKGSLADVIKGADVFIGVSAPGTVTQEMVRTMAPNPILFPMANPTPEIMPEEAKAAGAAVIYIGKRHIVHPNCCRQLSFSLLIIIGRSIGFEFGRFGIFRLIIAEIADQQTDRLFRFKLNSRTFSTLASTAHHISSQPLQFRGQSLHLDVPVAVNGSSYLQTDAL